MTCVACGGEVSFIGQLGRLRWFRCRACGMEQSKKAKTRPKARSTKKNPSDEMRRQWVTNDEGLYNWQRRSGLPMREFIRQNRKEIDEVIANVTGGKKPAHYLAYPPRQNARRRPRNPWAICAAAGLKRGTAKYERCVRKVKAKMNDPFANTKRWVIYKWDAARQRKEFIAKVMASYREIKHYFPGANLTALGGGVVGMVMVTKKSQVRFPKRLTKSVKALFNARRK